MGDAVRLGNINDLKHDCRRHGLGDGRYTNIGDVKRCSCGRLWIFDFLVLGRGWKPLRGRRRRRFEAALAAEATDGE